MATSDIAEKSRLKAQENLDAVKMHETRKRLGQFATPSPLATEMLQYAESLFPAESRIRFLDPAFGTGAFYSALLRIFSRLRIDRALGYEIDPEYGKAAKELWNDQLLQLEIVDFTRSSPPETKEEMFNLIICNPPYVRHHHLAVQEKLRLAQIVEGAVGLRLSGYSGLYCYFLLLSHRWMETHGLAGWLVPSGFMDVNYGIQVKKYLLDQVTLLRIHRFNPSDVQFEDALVSSAVLWFQKDTPPIDHTVQFTYGGTLLRPAISKLVSVKMLRQSAKWTQFPIAITSEKHDVTQSQTRLSDFFEVKRGLATGANGYFILTLQKAAEHELPKEFLRPILPPPRCLEVDEIQSDSEGNPLLENKFLLLSCDLPENAVRDNYPTLWKYLLSGIQEHINERYLCRHRHPWYSQENRPPSPLLCTYMGRFEGTRGRPFRFILNHSQATATNVYLMLYPRSSLKKMLERDTTLLRGLWKTLNDTPSNTLLREGRVYGGGLYKLEPKELGGLPAEELVSLVSKRQNGTIQ